MPKNSNFAGRIGHRFAGVYSVVRIGSRNKRPQTPPSISQLPIRTLIDGPLGFGKHAPHHGLEKFERKSFALRIEGGPIVERAEFHGLPIARMVLEPVAHMAIEPQVMEEIIALEYGVLFDHPV